MKKILCVIVILVMISSVCIFATSCKSQNKMEGWEQYTAGEFGVKNSSNPLVEITFSTGHKVRVELYPQVAPKTVANFLKLAKANAYDGLCMHRII